MLGNCIGNCGFIAPPPPDTILSMPPPPLPSFLLPKAAVIAPPTNESHPCFATLMCDPNPHPRESGMDFVELTGIDGNGLENTWLFVLISSCVGVLILGGLLAVILLKCRDTLFSSCNLSYHDSNIKQGAMSALGEPSKSNPFMAGGILYPCTAANSRDTLQSQLASDSRLLWATLTPHGTRHFISDYPNQSVQDVGLAGNHIGVNGGSIPNGIANGLAGGGGVGGGSGGVHYEVVDYRAKPQNQPYRDYVKRTPIKSFDNSGFIDYDYEDPTPLMESYHDDMDSGYQEPQEIFNSMQQHQQQRSSPRPHVSTPTRIDNPNMAPLNYYPSNTRSHHSSQQSTLQRPTNLAVTTTLNRKPTTTTTINRRISDVSSYNGQQL